MRIQILDKINIFKLKWPVAVMLAALLFAVSTGSTYLVLKKYRYSPAPSATPPDATATTAGDNSINAIPNPDATSASATGTSKGKSKTSGSGSTSAGSGSTSGNTSGSTSSSTGTSGSSGSTGTDYGNAFVAFYSDSQSDTDAEDARHQKVVSRILASGANPVFHGGDLMEDGTQNSLDRFNAVAGSLVSSRSFYGALGNNDRVVGDAATPSPLYLGNFSFPNNERWYSVNAGNLHLVVLDSAFCSACASQLSWLESDLKSSDSQSRITGVLFHHPTFIGTINNYLVNNGVDFVVDGHYHTYAKSSSNGIYYFTLPGGGSLGYALANISASQVQITVYNEDGGTIDSQTFSER